MNHSFAHSAVGEPASPALSADPWRSQPARIVRIADEIAGVRSYDLVLGDTAARAAYRFVPGQFNML